MKYKVLDIPSERSSHKIPTPRGGGIAIVVSWYIGIIILYTADLVDRKLFLALMSGVILAVIGLLDDLYRIKPALRLMFQFITAVIALVFIIGGDSSSFLELDFIHPLILYTAMIIGILWFINLYNFLDGIDAYASVETMFIAITMFLFTGDIILLVLVSVVLGFIYWNWPNAKIFMGDVGSTQLGFIIVILGIYYHNTTDFKIIHWLMLSSLFWFDATFTLFRRLINGEKLGKAHKKHAYQRIVQAGFSHLKTNILALLLNLIVLIIVIISYYVRTLRIPGFLFILLLFYGITRIIDKKVPFQKESA